MNKTIIKENNTNKFKTAKGKINRNIVLDVAKALDIKFKKEATVCIDETLWKKSGHNQEPKIIDISKFSKSGELSELTRRANNLANEIYTKNKQRFTMIKNLDTNINIELGRLGINKTFSKNVPLEKLPTANKLKQLIKNSIYFKTSYSENDANVIRYHHFLVPVKVYNREDNAFVRIVIKEYKNRKDLNNKFYYHQIEYLDK